MSLSSIAEDPPLIMVIQSLSIQASYHTYRNKAEMIAEAVMLLFCILVIVPYIVRTCRLWWSQEVRQAAVTYATMEKPYDYEAAYMQQAYYPQIIEPVYHGHDAKRPPFRAVDSKSVLSSRPHSVLSGSDTLTAYPMIDNVAHTTTPSRAPSKAAPSYTSRA